MWPFAPALSALLAAAALCLAVSGASVARAVQLVVRGDPRPWPRLVVLLAGQLPGLALVVGLTLSRVVATIELEVQPALWLAVAPGASVAAALAGLIVFAVRPEEPEAAPPPEVSPRAIAVPDPPLEWAPPEGPLSD